ncbi:hypothetical protein DN062_05670 [Nitrincola tibetensis]|uniref:Lipoprotein n=1 Tax=Nitrincola tibetensis TaxID=2219697 RepID=A0A364NPK7_9GAMM|nr:hypothetical protein [Nitrincola tibetensis]RAU18962.1 hypothetical protein DN062_05670 [Nitrincola tibetensis]
MKLLPIFLMVTMLTLTACTSLPNTDVGKRAYLEQVIDSDQKIIIHSMSTLYRNTFEISIRGINRAETAEFVELVLTEAELQFYEWRDDAREYNLKYRFRLEDISKLKEGTYFGLPYIAAKIGNDYISFIVPNYEPRRHNSILSFLSAKTGVQVSSE